MRNCYKGQKACLRTIFGFSRRTLVQHDGIFLRLPFLLDDDRASLTVSSDFEASRLRIRHDGKAPDQLVQFGHETLDTFHASNKTGPEPDPAIASIDPQRSQRLLELLCARTQLVAGAGVGQEPFDFVSSLLQTDVESTMRICVPDLEPLSRSGQDDRGVGVGNGVVRGFDGVEGSEEGERDAEEEDDVFEAGTGVHEGGEEIHNAEVGVGFVEGDAHCGVGGEGDVCFQGEGVGGVGEGDLAEGDGLVFEVVWLEDFQEAD